MRNYCTILDDKYTRQAAAMASSMQKHCQPYTLWCLAMNDAAAEALAGLPNVKVMGLYAIASPELLATQSGRTWAEFVWTVKSSWIAWMLENVGDVLYLDCDGYFFSSPEPLYAEIGDAPLAITPHRFPARLRNYLVNGQCNAGVVYAARAGLPCIRDWAAQCVDWCYLRYGESRLADQKYLDEWPAKYGAHHIANIGVNCAPWNQEQYDWKRKDGLITLNDTSLIWYHFHQGLTPYYPINDFVKKNIYAEYEAALCGSN
jgi:hypothetical protein